VEIVATQPPILLGSMARRIVVVMLRRSEMKKGRKFESELSLGGRYAMFE
jgi:hypothetical protein